MPDQTAVPLTVTRFGNIGNSMMQLAYAEKLRRSLAYPVEIRAHLPEWGWSCPNIDDDNVYGVALGEHRERVKIVSAVLSRIKPQALHMSGLSARIGNMLTPDELSAFFPLDDDGVALPDDALVINVRAAEVATRIHDDYGVLPISYFRYLCQTTGLRPVFIGQVDTEPYASVLRTAFPGEQFISSVSARHDFQTLRRARNIAIGVSTFSWLAAYIGQADQVHIPVVGIFNPVDRPDLDLLPTDRRYRFHQLDPDAWRGRFEDFEAKDAAFGEIDADALWALRKRQRFGLKDARLHLRILKQCLLSHSGGR
jgi:hypothetical protein